MYKLMEGIVAFSASITAAEQAQFSRLALGQWPDAVFVGCSDSRVDPRIFASSEPGDVFVHRNVGNLVPPNGTSVAKPESASSLATIEFALWKFKVSHIIICGHSKCGAMTALWEDTEIPEETPHVGAWLEHGRRSLERLRGGAVLDETLDPRDQLSQINVLQQMDHLRLHSLIRKRIEMGALQLHGWWFDISTHFVYSFDEEESRFSRIDRRHADRIIARAATVRKLG